MKTVRAVARRCVVALSVSVAACSGRAQMVDGPVVASSRLTPNRSEIANARSMARPQRLAAINALRARLVARAPVESRETLRRALDSGTVAVVGSTDAETDALAKSLDILVSADFLEERLEKSKRRARELPIAALIRRDSRVPRTSAAEIWRYPDSLFVVVALGAGATAEELARALDVSQDLRRRLGDFPERVEVVRVPRGSYRIPEHSRAYVNQLLEKVASRAMPGYTRVKLDPVR